MVSDALKHEVIERAGGRCEYCLLHQQDSIKTHEVDHIAARKHGGETDSENLCLSCVNCNRHKGSDLTSLDPETGEIIPLFHPRRDMWDDHFRLDGPRIVPLTAKGRVTAFLLQMNVPDRLIEREILIRLGRYPG
jgi:hypothetical protein